MWNTITFFSSAALGWWGTLDRELSRLVLKTYFFSEWIFRMCHGRRINILAPFDPKEFPLSGLTKPGAEWTPLWDLSLSSFIAGKLSEVTPGILRAVHKLRHHLWGEGGYAKRWHFDDRWQVGEGGPTMRYWREPHFVWIHGKKNRRNQYQEGVFI